MSESKRQALERNNQDQIREALGDDNRYYANRHYGRDATDEELLFYYISHGGATGHRDRMANDPPPKPHDPVG